MKIELVKRASRGHLIGGGGQKSTPSRDCHLEEQGFPSELSGTFGSPLISEVGQSKQVPQPGRRTGPNFKA